jgi:hypothetical protein
VSQEKKLASEAMSLRLLLESGTVNIHTLRVFLQRIEELGSPKVKAQKLDLMVRAERRFQSKRRINK